MAGETAAYLVHQRNPASCVTLRPHCRRGMGLCCHSRPAALPTPTCLACNTAYRVRSPKGDRHPESPARSAHGLSYSLAGRRFYRGYSMSFVWDDTNVAMLKRMRAAGKTALEISQEIGGVSRSAVLGKMNRLGMVNVASGHGGYRGPAQRLAGKRAAARLKAKQAKPAPKPKPTTPVVRSPLPEAPTPLPIDTRVAKLSFDELENNHCRFPIGTPGTKGFGFCGDERAPDRPYCADCCERAFQPREPRVSRKSQPNSSQSQTDFTP